MAAALMPFFVLMPYRLTYSYIRMYFTIDTSKICIKENLNVTRKIVVCRI